MKKEIFFLINLSLFFLIYQQIFGQESSNFGVSIICSLADFFSKLVLAFCFLAILKVGYDLITGKGSAEDLYSSKKTIAFILIGGALAVSYITFLKKILEKVVC